MILIVKQVACVQNVLDSLIPALLADKNRKFIYVEQAGSFFNRLTFSLYTDLVIKFLI